MKLMKKVMSGVLACAIAVPFSNRVFADAVKLKGINVERRGLGATYEFRVTVENPKPTLQYRFSLEFGDMQLVTADFSERDTCVYNVIFNGNHKVRESEMPDVLRRILRLTLQTQNQIVNAGAAVLLPAKFDKAVKMFRL